MDIDKVICLVSIINSVNDILSSPYPAQPFLSLPWSALDNADSRVPVVKSATGREGAVLSILGKQRNYTLINKNMNKIETSNDKTKANHKSSRREKGMKNDVSKGKDPFSVSVRLCYYLIV